MGGKVAPRILVGGKDYKMPTARALFPAAGDQKGILIPRADRINCAGFRLVPP